MKTRNKYYNPNPKKHETGDCVVRALCKATGKDWNTVYQELYEIGFELKVMPNADKSWIQYLENEGFKRIALPVKKGQRRMRVNDFAKKNRKGTFILRVANHIVTCVDSYYYDIWDCADSAVYAYFTKEG